MTDEQDRNVEEVAGPEPELPAEATAEAAAPEEEAVDELAALKQQLEETRAREAEYLDGWRRARAELANARRRFEREQEQAYTNAKSYLLARLLPIVDDFERAFATLPHNLSGLTWVGGVLLIQRKLQLLLEQEGVVPIEAEGQAFDPLLHQAVTHEPSDSMPEGHIIGELQRGYRLGDQVLRPSMVRVSSGPPPAPAAEAEPVAGEPTDA